MEQNCYMTLLTKTGDCDMVPMEKVYHNHCLCAFYKKVNNVIKNEIQMENDNDCVFYGIVLSEVINHIKKTFETSSGSHPIFLLAELRELLIKRISDTRIKIIASTILDLKMTC